MDPPAALYTAIPIYDLGSYGHQMLSNQVVWRFYPQSITNFAAAYISGALSADLAKTGGPTIPLECMGDTTAADRSHRV